MGKRKIFENVKAKAISRNRKAYSAKRRGKRAAHQNTIAAHHAVTRYNNAKRKTRNKEKKRERGMNLAREKAGMSIDDIVSAKVKDDYKEFRPTNGVTGWFSGNGYAVSERERLRFKGRCATCNNTGKVSTSDKNKRVYPATMWGRHMHHCKEPCTNCPEQKIVYNRVALKKGKKRDGTYKYHPVDTECTLVGIETKWFGRAPQATIKIDGKTYVVYSTDLSINTVKDEADRRASNKKRMQDICKVNAAANAFRKAGAAGRRAQRGSPRPLRVSRRNSNASNAKYNVMQRRESLSSSSRQSSTSMPRSGSLSSRSSRQSSTSMPRIG